MSETFTITNYHLSNLAPEKPAMKRTTLLYYSSRQDQELAKTIRLREREARNVAYLRDATTFSPAIDTDPQCHVVLIMPDVRPHHREMIKGAYPGKVNEDFDFSDLEKALPQPEATPQPQAAAPATDDKPVDLTMMTRKALREYADSKGIKIDNRVQRREDLIQAIQSHA